MKNFYAVLIGLIALTLAVLIADKLIGEREIKTRDPLETQAIAERIRPLGQIAEPKHSVNLINATPTPAAETVNQVNDNAELAITAASNITPTANNDPVNQLVTTDEQPKIATASSDQLDNSKKIYVNSCFVCHETGAAGSPKRGDQNAWQLRLSQGKNNLLLKSFKNFNNMPYHTCNMNLKADEIAMALVYLLFDIK